MATVAIYKTSSQHRSRVICEAMFQGVRAGGDRPRIVEEAQYTGPEADVAVMYGMYGNLFKAFNDYVAAGKPAVYVDLGYWGRREGGRWTGFHKVSVNSRHPTKYFQRRPHDGNRLRRFDLRLKPWREGRHILIAGMGHKTASVGEPAGGEWETAVIAELRQHTDRPIVYRPKPSWKTAPTIPGTQFSSQHQDLREVLNGAHCVVTHHSNTAVDGLVEGIPAFCWQGVGSVLASRDLSQIESPAQPDGREQWMRDIAWCQWNVDEMRLGKPWLHLKSEGLIP